MDRLETFIKSNRASFDQIESVDQKALWIGITQQQNARSNKWLVLKIAAAIVLFSSIAFIIGSQLQSPKPDMVLLLDQLPQWNEVDQKYSNEIEGKLQYISQQNFDIAQFPELEDELEVIETDFKAHVNDLNQFGGDERIIRLLFQYHEQKLRILETIILEIEKQKYHDALQNDEGIL